ncbi:MULTISPECIES: histidine kinase dimerization/phospho-acceptor domain-containing protein [Paraburkholderia]|nr:histidine kinase dimerization/phospho-acceptor domain-containing protein [Paraburkholderia podalyriae]
MVVVCTYIIQIPTPFPVQARFDLGWYVRRVYALLSGSLVLVMLLKEITMLYAQLLHAVLAQRREQAVRSVTGEVVSASIAHEVKQPLSAMLTNADAALRWLDRSAPAVDNARAALERISTDGHRAGAIIDNIRALFPKDARTWSSLDVNDLIGDARAVNFRPTVLTL